MLQCSFLVFESMQAVIWLYFKETEHTNTSDICACVALYIVNMAETWKKESPSSNLSQNDLEN